MNTFRIRHLALLAAVGALVACQTTDVAAPSESSLVSTSAGVGGFSVPKGKGFAGNAQNLFQATRCIDRKAVSASGVFGPAGGTLTFGTSRLVIPGGALRDTVTISATIVDTATSQVVFTPHGLQFEKPAGLLLDTEGCVFSPDQVPSVVYLDENGNVVEFIEATWDPKWKTFAAAIRHFSNYSIAF